MANETTIRISAVNATTEAFRQVQGNLNKLQGSLQSIAGPLAAAFSVGAITTFAKRLVDAADRLKDLSEQTGISAENLSKFGNAAQLNGSSAEEFQAAIVKFSNSIGEAASGTQAQVDAFRTLGVSIKDANGNLRPTIDIFKDVADRYSQTADGAGKLAITQDLLGKAGSRLIPTLNQGSAALDKYRATFSQDFIDASAQFNDEIDKLSINFQRLAASNLTGLIGAFNQLVNPESVSQAQKLRSEIEKMQGVASASFGTNFLEKVLGINLGSADSKQKIEQAQELLREINRMEAATAAKKSDAKKPSIVPTKTDMTPIDELVDRNKKILELLEKGKTATQKYYQALEELDALQSGLSDDAYFENLLRINEEYQNAQPKIQMAKTGVQEYAQATKDLAVQIDTAAVSALNNMEDALAGVFMGTMTVQDAFKSMARSIVQDLIKIQIQRSITGPLADALGSFLGPVGKKAIGGSVSLGSPYVVGERGPELFVPNQNGAIIPNNAMGGGGGTTIVQNLNISTGVSQTVRAEIQNMMPRITEATKAAVADSKRRGGTFGKMMS